MRFGITKKLNKFIFLFLHSPFTIFVLGSEGTSKGGAFADGDPASLIINCFVLMSFTLRLRNSLFSIEKPIVMAIINITPDSFYKSHGMLSEGELIDTVARAIEEGASILDIGAHSTRPQSEIVPEEEELRRIEFALRLVRKHFPDIVISIDTYRASIAQAAIDNGGDIINDISGGSMDEGMFEMIGRLKVPYVLTHMRGTPQTMHLHTQYDHLVGDVLSFFEKRVRKLHALGVSDIILDPGFGFAKTLEQNYELLSHLSHFKTLGLPLLAGVSHKSMLYKLLDIDVKDSLNATTVANTIALLGGATILRVHEVRPAIEAIKIVQATNIYQHI